MNTIAILDQRDFEPVADISERANYYVRRAARAVLADENGHIALLFSNARRYHKLPGGGIEEGEDMLQALKREIMEETGSEADIGDELGEVAEWRDATQMKQISYCFTAKLSGAKGAPAFTESELADGFEVVWMPVSTALDLLKDIREHDDLLVRFMVNRDIAIIEAASKR